MEKDKELKRENDQGRPFIFADKAYLDLTDAESVAMEMILSPGVLESEYFLVMDIYSSANHIHPQGHVGWWQLELDDRLSVSINVEKTDQGIRVTFPSSKGAQDSWENREMISGLDEEVLWLHVVLRQSRNRAIAFEDILPVYISSESLGSALALQKSLLADFTHLHDTAWPWYCWPRDVHVCIVTQTFSLPDAVGSFVLDTCRLLRRSNIPCSIYASRFDPMLRPAVRPVQELLAGRRPKDLVLYNLSIYDEYFDAIQRLSCRKALYYHGITPPKYFRVYDGEFVKLCEKAYDHLGKSGGFDKVAANSVYSAQELQSFARQMETRGSGSDTAILRAIAPEKAQTTGVRTLKAIEKASAPSTEPCATLGNTEEEFAEESRVQGKTLVISFPPVLNPRTWEMIETEDVQLPNKGTMLLYVGRVAPHKKIEDLITLQFEYLKLDPDSHLVIVGKPQFPGYVAYLEYLLETKYKHAQITFLHNLRRGQLKAVYTRSSAYVSMSEHEGFCVSLIEAMYFGKPIFAYAQPAVRQTLGESGKVFFRKDFGVIADEIFRLLNNQTEMDHLVAVQSRRFNEIAVQADGRAIWRLLEDLVFGDASVT